jgi:hypothetical protein
MGRQTFVNTGGGQGREDRKAHGGEGREGDRETINRGARERTIARGKG